MNKILSTEQLENAYHDCLHDHDILGSGTGRIAFKISDDTVIKLARNKLGVSQNIQEIKVYRDSLGKEYNDILCPIDLERSTKYAVFMKYISDVRNDNDGSYSPLDDPNFPDKEKDKIHSLVKYHNVNEQDLRGYNLSHSGIVIDYGVKSDCVIWKMVDLMNKVLL